MTEDQYASVRKQQAEIAMNQSTDTANYTGATYLFRDQKDFDEYMEKIQRESYNQALRDLAERLGKEHIYNDDYLDGWDTLENVLGEKFSEAITELTKGE